MVKSSYHLFKIESYRVWLLSRFVTNFARQMEALTIVWQVYHISKSPLALGFVGLSQAIPYICVALWAGHFADHYDKRNQITLAVSGLTLCSLGIFLLTMSGHPSLPLIYLLLGIGGVLTSFEISAASAYVQLAISKEDFPQAVAWNLSLYNFATIAGPIFAGWIISKKGPTFSYAIITSLFFVSIFLAARLRKIMLPKNEIPSSSFESIKMGFRFIVTQPIIWGVMVVDMLAVFFGDVVAILPIFAEMLQAGPLGLGFLKAAPATGSFLVSFFHANRSFIQIRWKHFLSTVTVFGLCMVGFALSKVFFLSFIFLWVSGMADGISVIIRQSIYQANTPDAIKGRVSSVSGIFIRTSNELGAFESGFAAHLLGTVPSVIFGGAVTLFVVSLMRLKFSHLDKQESLGRTS